MLDSLGSHNLTTGLPELASHRLAREQENSVERSNYTLRNES